MSKAKNNQHTFWWFMGLMEKRLPVYLCAIVVSTLGLAGTNVANSYLAKNIINAAQTREMDGVYLMVILNFLVIIASQLLWRVGIIRYNIEAKIGVAKVEKQVFSKAMRLPMSYYEQHNSGNFMSRLTYDTEKAGDIYSGRLRRISASVISSVIYLIPMFYFNWLLTLCLFGLSIVTFFVNYLFVKPMKRAGSTLSAQNGVMTEKLTNILAGIELTKIFPIGNKILGDYDEQNNKCFETQKRTNYMSAGLECLNTMFDLLGALAFLGLGIVFVYYKMVSLGELTAIYTLYGSFRVSFADIGRYLPQMMNCVANAQKVRDFLNLDEEMEFQKNIKAEIAKDSEPKKIPAKTSTVNMDNAKKSEAGKILTINNLTFGYNEDRKIIDNFSLSVKAGTSVAITGVSGRGKSTLAKLLLGFYKPICGQISICGKKYEDMALEDIRNCIGYVPQEPYLYGVSIAENIAYGRAGQSDKAVTMDEIIEAAKAANAHEFIMKLPEGYNTVAGERGNQLSGGEKQRIAIARAIIKNAPVLLLDEATSALDNESEKLVNEAINRLCKNRTTIMIAHRASTIAMADVVCQL